MPKARGSAMRHRKSLGAALWAAAGLLLRVRLATAQRIHLKGEPKSGTTWFEALFVQLGTLCVKDCQMRTTRGTTRDRALHMHIRQGNRTTVEVTTVKKHTIPDMVGGCVAHPNTLVHVRAPCALTEASDERDVETCAARCRGASSIVKYCGTRRRPCANQPVHETDDTAHIHRDPRAVAVSACYHLHQEADLDGCVRERYATTALWMRFRQAWFSDRALLDVAYEDLVRCPHEPLRRMAAALGFPAVADAALARVLEAAAGARTRHRHHVGTYRDDPRLGNATLAWMDAIHSRLNFSAAYAAGSCSAS